jgi:hypothetical protein
MSYIGNRPKINTIKYKPLSSDPTNPQEGEVFYSDGTSRSEGLWIYKNGNWVFSNSSGGQGNKNYLSEIVTSQSSVANTGNGNFELGSTIGWSLGVVGTLTNGIPTGTPTFGSGASGNLNISTVSSGQLSGSYSLSYASSAATTQGDMFASDAFYIDSSDQAKVLTWKFYYKAQTNPSNANWSGTSSNSFGVAIWDVDNSVWVANTGNFGMTQSSGIGICTGSFQTSTNATQYRLVVYNANATSGAVTVYFDDFFVGPQTSPIGTVVTDWINYTPTTVGFGTISAASFQSRRVGDCLHIQGKFTTGTVTASTASISIGFNGVDQNVSIDTNKIAALSIIGSAQGSLTSTTHFAIYPVTTGSLTTFGFSRQDSTVALGAGQQPANTVAATGSLFSFTAIVPIVGWSSNVQMSNDTDTRVVAASAYLSTSAAYTNDTVLVFNTVNYDTHGAYNSSTGIYTIPVSGFYETRFMTLSAATTGASLYTAVNGGVVGYHGSILALGNVQGGGVVGFQAKAGDQITFRVNGSFTRTGGAGLTVFDIKRLSGPSVVAATESVNCRYTNSAGTSLPGGANTLVPFANKTYDSHNAYNTTTGLYTVPVSGKYLVSCSVSSPVNISSGQQISISVLKNGVNYGRLGNSPGNGGVGNKGPSGADVLDCLAGDTISITVYTDVSTSLDTTATFNRLSITRVGN